MEKPDPNDDPEFGGPTAKSEPSFALHNKLMRAFCWMTVYPFVGYFGFVLVFGMVKEAVAALSAERLDQPVAVRVVDGKSLLLADGRRLSLRFLKRVPGDDPVFRSAVSHGVEVDDRGGVFGLLTFRPICGLTLEAYHVKRVNLSEVSAAIDPDCVDDAAVPVEVIETHRPGFRAENSRMVSSYLLTEMGSWRRDFEWTARAGGVVAGPETDRARLPFGPEILPR